MKRILAAIFVVVLAFSSVVVLSSCGPKPQMDLEKAEDNLKDEDYSVTYVDDEDALGVGVEERLYASKEGDSLTIIKFETSKMASLYYEELKLSRDSRIDGIKLDIKATKYILDKFEKDLSSSEIDSYEDELKELEESLDEYKDEYIIGKSGKTVWYGTKDAIKDSK